MQTKWMMRASAVFLGLLGLAATFLPQELSPLLGGAPDPLTVGLLQLAGGLYLGFAILDWFARDLAIGGIYNRPLVTGNLVHFTVVGMALVKTVLRGARHPALVALTLLYCLFALWFGRAVFHSPARRQAE
jgi:hypothetical protein